MTDLYLCPEAEDELDALYETDEETASLIDVLLEELAGDQDMLGRLFRPNNHFLYMPPFEIKVFAEARKRGKNIFILKVRNDEGELLNHRVLVAYHAQKDRYHVLTVANREISYDTSDPLFEAVLQRYERCGVPDYR